MNNYNLTSIPFLQKVKSSSREQTILLFEYEINFDYLEFLQVNANLSFSKESMMTFIFSEISKEENIHFITEEYFINILYNQSADSEKYFYKEIVAFCKECNKISHDLYKIFTDYKLYENGVLLYQFADLVVQDILILHRPNKIITYATETNSYSF